MPGILYHLCFAEEVFKLLDSTKVCINKKPFMCGNLIPDLATDKKNSHYRKGASMDGFFVPDLDRAKAELFQKTNEVKLGMYCHLYLDHYFIENYIIPEFIWDKATMTVTNPRNGKVWDVKTFLSQEGMYGAYTEINTLLLQDGHVSMKTVQALPEILPNTGIELFDTRKDRTWKEELEGYLAEKKPYTGDIFDYDRIIKCIKEIAVYFALEVSA